MKRMWSTGITAYWLVAGLKGMIVRAAINYSAAPRFSARGGGWIAKFVPIYSVWISSGDLPVRKDQEQIISNRAGVNFQSPLNEFVISSASRLVSGMLEAEVEEFLSGCSQLADDCGKPRVVRNGYLPERKVRTALGKVPVKIPRVRDRLKAIDETQRIKFNSRIISPYQRRTNIRGQLLAKFLTELNRGDFAEAAALMLGTKRELVTPAIVSRLQHILSGSTGASHHHSTVNILHFI